MSEEKMIAGSFFIDDKGNKVEVVDAKARKELNAQKEANATQDEAIAKKLDASALPTAINTALAQAKETGEFDGAPGAPGEPGEDGKTPEKGVDYWTEADKQEIVSDVLAALPNASGVTF